MRVVKAGESIVLEDGDWVKLPDNFMYQRCCSCGLMHLWEFDSTETGFMLRATALSDADAAAMEARFQAECQNNIQ